MTETQIHEDSTNGFRLEMDQIDQLLQNGFFRSATEEMSGNSLSNLIETWASYSLQIALPGTNPDKLEIEIVARQVIVRGRHHVAEIESGTDLWRGIPSGTFELVFRLPAEVDGDNAEAHYFRGILTLRMPKLSHLKPKRLKVQVLD